MTSSSGKQLFYNSTRQAAIVPVLPNRLMHWDVAAEPRCVAETSLTFHLSRSARSHPAVLLPGGDQLAIAHWSDSRTYIDLLDGRTGARLQQIVLQPRAYEEVGLEDERCGHQACSEVGALTLTPCQRYLVVAEMFGDLQLIDLRHLGWQPLAGRSPIPPASTPSEEPIEPATIRLSRRWTDYSGLVLFDPQLKFLIVESTDQFKQFDWYRIDDLAQDQLTYLRDVRLII